MFTYRLPDSAFGVNAGRVDIKDPAVKQVIKNIFHSATKNRIDCIEFKKKLTRKVTMKMESQF
jgi:hypothetical protein